jgi:predicted DNA-binding antitoxin AbrB/MazE fold protein
MKPVDAFYEEGIFRPVEPLELTQGERVRLIVVRQPDPRRWNLERLAQTGAEEDLYLARQGLDQWAAELDDEDRL